MGFWSNLGQDVDFLLMAKRMLNGVKDVNSSSSNLVADDLERTVERHTTNTAFIENNREWTYGEFDAYANRVAHWAVAEGCEVGDTVAIFVRNRLEYVALWYGLSKVGVIPALINYQLRAKSLAHCINISHTKLAIVDIEMIDAWKSAQKQIDGNPRAFAAFGQSPKSFGDFDTLVAKQNDHRPDKSIRVNIRAGDLLMKMFTSGTTGLPKAAKVTHTRAQYYLRGFALASKSNSKDRIIMVLPLYHATGGLCGVGIALSKGGAVIVRSKFSVSSFWDEVVEYKATMMMYVGELCRFLLNAPEHKYERAHSLRCIVGNGLRPDVWAKFVERFNIPNVVEFYGATEGNISLINAGGPVGAVGRLPEFLSKKTNGDIIRYDVESGTHIKGPDGLYQKAAPNEIGELIGEIKPGETRFKYDGYESKEASSKKVLHDVFKKGDQWFRTGDLMSRDARGYCYFVDRIGDTFRWKAENVSTGEVAEALTAFEGVDQANVYGVEVPGCDGRAGMASLVAERKVKLDDLFAHLENALPHYARPVFLRITPETEVTTTFKYKKTNLVKEGYDPDKVPDALFIADTSAKTFVPLDKVMFTKINKGELKF
jgi:fatty-acyl-CoA synthase